MAERTCLAVVLAAGEGTRMRSSLPKVLHPIGNEALLAQNIHVMHQVGRIRIALHGYNSAEDVEKLLAALRSEL